jgi:hypothetical protein
MNASQISTLEAALQKIEEIDVNAKISTVFVGQDLEAVRIAQYSVPDFVAIIKRIITQLSNELVANGFYLPIGYSVEANTVNNLQNDITSLLNTLNSPSQQTLSTLAGTIDRLVNYQISFGFWDKSTRKIHSASEVRIKELETKLSYVAEQLKQNLAKQEVAIKQLDGEKDKLTLFTSQKQQELQQIASNLQSTNTSNQQISQLLTTATATNGKIETVQKTQETNLAEQKKKFEDQTKVFDILNKTYEAQRSSIDEKIETVDQQIGKFNKHLEFVESKTAYFEERNTYLDSLIGREVGASLFETFKQRKTELEKPVRRWLCIVIVASVLTFVAVLAIFTNFFHFKEVITFDWQNVVINGLKSSPFFFLLFYSIAQYNKERHYQEEYAFKSAVALTIKAYADVVEAQELKDNLIVKSVTEVYRTPHPDKGKRSKGDSSILDTAKDLLGTALEVMQKK